MVVLAHKWHVFKAPDPLFFMVLLLTHTTPTAINLQVGECMHVHVHDNPPMRLAQNDRSLI